MASAKFERFLTRLREVPRSPELDVAAMRRNMDRVGGNYPDGVTETPVSAGGVPAVWVGTPDAAPDAAVLYLHGGGYVAGSIASHRNLTGHLARAVGCRLLVADYRLAPEHPFPAAVDDAVAAYRWLLAQGLSPDKVAIAGDSAGGGLAVACLVALRDAGDPMPAAGVPISALVDMEATGDSMVSRAAADPMVDPAGIPAMVSAYVGPGGDRRHPLASPLHADLSGLPPLLIHVGDAEVLLDDSVRLAERTKAAGVDTTLEVWPEMVHVWHLSAGFVPEADEAVARIAAFLRPYLGL